MCVCECNVDVIWLKAYMDPDLGRYFGIRVTTETATSNGCGASKTLRVTKARTGTEIVWEGVSSFPVRFGG